MSLPLVTAYLCSVVAWMSGAVLYEQTVASEQVTITLPVFMSSTIGCIIATWIIAAQWFKRQHRVEDLERKTASDSMEIKRIRAEMDDLRKNLTRPPGG